MTLLSRIAVCSAIAFLGLSCKSSGSSDVKQYDRRTDGAGGSERYGRSKLSVEACVAQLSHSYHSYHHRSGQTDYERACKTNRTVDFVECMGRQGGSEFRSFDQNIEYCDAGR